MIEITTTLNADAVPATCTNQWHVELIEVCRALEALAESQA
jgi:hypothetical protein